MRGVEERVRGVKGVTFEGRGPDRVSERGFDEPRDKFRCFLVSSLRYCRTALTAEEKLFVLRTSSVVVGEGGGGCSRGDVFGDSAKISVKDCRDGSKEVLRGRKVMSSASVSSSTALKRSTWDLRAIKVALRVGLKGLAIGS